jgi:hypothetical protein
MVRFHKFSQRSALQRDGVTKKRGIGKAQQYLLILRTIADLEQVPFIAEL